MSEELLAAAKERIKSLLEPINGGTGEDISYDEKFDEIKAETEKLSSLAGEECNWGSVLVNAEEILEDKSKDFRVACYWATAKMRDGSLEDILDGFVLLNEIIEQYWETMFPPLRRIRARAGMVGWLSDQVGPVLMDRKLKASDADMLKLLSDQSVALDQMGRERFADHYPGMSKLREAFRELTRRIPKAEPKPKPKPKPEPAADAAAGAGAASTPARSAPVVVAKPAELVTAADATRALEETGRKLVKIASILRATKPENALSYRFNRMGIWLDMDAAPVVQDGRTMVPPPPSHVMGAMDGLAKANDWLALLNEAEAKAGSYILWLDLHRQSATAMSALGALFMKAKKELLVQVALMLRRVPTLPTLQYQDGTPMADAQTQMWIESEVLPVLGGDGDGGGGGGGGGGSSVLDEPIKEARDLAVKGELAKAIDVVAMASATAPTPADRFRGKLAIAQLCLQSGEYAIARGQLEGLTTMIADHHLTSWDPALCAQVYAGLFTAMKSINGAAVQQTEAQAMVGEPPQVPPEDLAAEKNAFEHLCQLDPALALKLGGHG